MQFTRNQICNIYSASEHWMNKQIEVGKTNDSSKADYKSGCWKKTSECMMLPWFSGPSQQFLCYTVELWEFSEPNPTKEQYINNSAILSGHSRVLDAATAMPPQCCVCVVCESWGCSRSKPSLQFAVYTAAHLLIARKIRGNTSVTEEEGLPWKQYRTSAREALALVVLEVWSKRKHLDGKQV